MKKLSKEEFYKTFDALWSGLREELFKVETLQRYTDDEHLESYRAFKRGDLDGCRELIRKEFEKENSDRNKKIAMTRVHIIEIPVTKYLRFEFETYKISEEYGEKIYLADWEKVKKEFNINEWKREDFLLFNQKTAIVNHFDEQNAYVYSEIFESENEVKLYLEVREFLLQNSIAFEEFLKAYNLK